MFQIFTSYHTSERDFDCFHFADKLFESRIDKIMYFLLPGIPMGPKRAPRGHLEVAATIKKLAQNSPENDPNLSIGTPGTRKLLISSHAKII